MVSGDGFGTPTSPRGSSAWGHETPPPGFFFHPTADVEGDDASIYQELL